MKLKLCGFMVFVISLTAFAQSDSASHQFTMKGYTLGESINETLAKSGEPQAVSDCQQFVANYKQKQFIPGAISKRERCLAILAANTGARSNVSLRDIYAHFDNGKLAGISLSFINSLLSADQQISYEKVVEDAIRKYGKPTDQGTTSWQNKFGAQWHPRFAVWTDSYVTVRVDEIPDSGRSNSVSDSTIKAFLRTELDVIRKDTLAGPNVFDK